MKKSIIAASAASLAVAALPVVGVFAATSTQFTDTLTVGVEGGCTMEDTSGSTGTYKNREFEGTITAGTSDELTAQTGTDLYTGGFTINCNTTTGNFKVTVGATNDGDLKDGNNAISPLAANATMGGNTSSWAIKSNAQGTTTANPYSDYKGFVAGDFITFAASSTESPAEITFNPSYKVYVAPGQTPGNYTGTVTYTITQVQ